MPVFLKGANNSGDNSNRLAVSNFWSATQLKDVNMISESQIRWYQNVLPVTMETQTTDQHKIPCKVQCDLSSQWIWFSVLW